MNNIPLVSVAIVTYNQKKYLEECINSVLEQDYPNIEIVVSDDASTDGTQEMLEEYAERYPKKFILLLAKDNKGITPNSNSAHFSCSGKYIAWMGGDDLMLPGKISKQVEYMEKNPNCTICYHNLDVFDSETNQTIRFFNNTKNSHEGNVKKSIECGTFNGACSNLVRRSKTPKHGFDVAVPVASDWLYWVETLASGGTINYIDEVLGRYRRHGNNVTKFESHITQNELDHLVSCQVIMSRYPEYIKSVRIIYSKRIFDLRHKLNYWDALLLSFGVYANIKSLVGLVVFLISFKKIKL